MAARLSFKERSRFGAQFLRRNWRNLLTNQRGVITVEQHWVPRFHDNIMLTYQQKGSELQAWLMPDMVHNDVRGAIDHHDRLGAVIASDVVDPFGQQNVLNPPSSRRAATLQSSDATVLVSDENTLRSMADPQSPYTNTIVAAIGRRIDKHIIDACTAAAEVASVTVGSGVITYSTQALPSSRIIGGATAIDLARIVNAGVLLTKAGVPAGSDRRGFLYAPGQEQNIMDITQASSSDFTKNQIHDRGTLSGLVWQGFSWKCIPDVMQIDVTVLQRMLNLTSTTRHCIAFDRHSIGLSVGRPQGAPSIHERPDLRSIPIQVRQAIMMRAVRVFEGGVVRVDCLEN